MTLTIKLTADAATGAGVDFNADLEAHFDGFKPYEMPIFLPATDGAETTQILHLDTPVEGSEAQTRLVLLDGSDFQYTFSNHSVSGTLDTVRLGRLGPAWDAGKGDLAVDKNGRVSKMADSITIGNLNIVNPVGEKGEVHEIVSGMMGGGLNGLEADPTALFKHVWAEAHDVTGSTGADRYAGTKFGDIARGLGGADVLAGKGGADTLSGGAGNDTLSGGAAADSLAGDAGADVLRGEAGNDVLKGGAGADVLIGAAGADTLDGGIGADRLEGGAGADRLTGGAGADVFVFATVAAAKGDQITDFRIKQGDAIDLAAIDARGNVKGNQSFTLIGDDAFSKTSGELRVWSAEGHTFVAGDVNGDGKADFTLTLTGALALTEAHFLL